MPDDGDRFDPPPVPDRPTSLTLEPAAEKSWALPLPSRPSCKDASARVPETACLACESKALPLRLLAGWPVLARLEVEVGERAQGPGHLRTRCRTAVRSVPPV